MHKVLVTSIGSFASELVVQGLKEIGYKVVGCDIYPKSWIATSQEVDAFYVVPRAAERELYLEALIEICESEDIQKIIPLVDEEIDVFCDNIMLFRNIGVDVLISDVDSVRICRNKWKMYCYIRENVGSVNCIPTELFINIEKENIRFPAVCKKVDGRSSQGLYKISDEIDWCYFTKKEVGANYIVQPMIAGTVVAVDVIRDDYNNVVVIPRKELLRTGNGAGTTVEIYSDFELERQSADLANALKLRGCNCFEFILTDRGEYFFIECNPRFGGGSMFSKVAGYDCIKNHIMAYEGKVIEPFSIKNNEIIARRYKEYIMN